MNAFQDTNAPCCGARINPAPASEVESKRERPLWYTETGAPRFCDFHPLFCADANADEVALIHLKCECCDCTIDIALSWSAVRSTQKRLTAGSSGVDHSYRYGAPPTTGCNAPLTVSGLAALWIREQGVWLKLDEMLCATTPFVLEARDLFCTEA